MECSLVFVIFFFVYILVICSIILCVVEKLIAILFFLIRTQWKWFN